MISAKLIIHKEVEASIKNRSRVGLLSFQKGKCSQVRPLFWEEMKISSWIQGNQLIIKIKFTEISSNKIKLIILNMNNHISKIINKLVKNNF